ncbi:MAG: S41 family peptidase [Bacteroides sp.]|nr:S41 family peptidase [Bacteroides sp.]
MDTFVLSQLVSLIIITGASIYLYIQRKALGRKIVCALYLLILGGIVCVGIKNYPKYWIRYHLTMNIKEQFVTEQEIEPEAYLKDFHEICDIVESKYALAAQKGISLKALREKYSAMVNQAKDNSGYFIALQRYFAELKNAHTSLIYNSYYALAKAEWRCDSLYVTGNLTKLPFKSGDKIISIDGTDALSWRDSMKNYVIASIEKARNIHTANYVFSSHIDTVRTLRLSRNDSVFQVKVSLSRDGKQQILNHNKSIRKAEKKEIQETAEKKKKEYLAVLTLSGFTEEETEEFIFKYKKVKDYPYLILDLRNNPGGLVRNMSKIAALLIKRPYQDEEMIEPSEESFKGKLYVMIGPYTFSAAEHLASILKESESAILVGEETGDDFGTTPLKFRTSQGTYFSIGYGAPQKTFKGEPREGKGIEPHFRITENADITNGINILKTTFGQLMNDVIESKKDMIESKKDSLKG